MGEIYSVERELFSVRAESRRDMTPDAIAQTVQSHLNAVMGPDADRGCLKQGFASIARKTGMTEGQIKRLFYGEWRVIPAHIFLKIEQLYRNHLDQMRARAEHDAAIYRARADEWDKRWGDLSSNGASTGSEGERVPPSTGLTISGNCLNG